MKVFIVEDEPLGLQRLVKLLADQELQLEVCGTAASIRAAVEGLREQQNLDLIFMDIELADGQCFEIFKQLEINTPVVFTTSYDEFALQAFKVNSIDYLLKPVRAEDLRGALRKFYRINKNVPVVPQALRQVEEFISQLHQGGPDRELRNRFLVKKGQRYQVVEVKDIAYFQAEGKLCYLRTWENQRFVLDYTLEQLTEMLEPHDFFRVNRSYLVQAKAIRNIQSYFNGKLILQLEPAAVANEVVISKEKATAFKKWLGR
ncbi:MAG: response regulator transcription factor [Lewinellaceae bacterium]|nr:response regulator transcription factor [Lewinellaceae bacterium]